MHWIGNGTVQNTTKFNVFLDSAYKNDPQVYLPSMILKYASIIADFNYDSFKTFSEGNFFSINPFFMSVLILIVGFYSFFYVSLKLQPDN